MTDQQIQQIVFSFQGGINTKQDEFQLQAPNLLQAQNVRFSTFGQVNKRPGFQPLSNLSETGTEITGASALANFNNELLKFDGQSIYSYLQSTQQWINRGPAFSIINTEYSIVRNSDQQNNPDATSLNGLEVYVWEDSAGGIRYSVLDSGTGAFIVSDQPLYEAGSMPKVVAGTNQFFVYFQLSNELLGYVTINTTTPNILSPLNVLFTDGLSTGFHYDALTYNHLPVVVYNNNINTNTPPFGNINVVYNSITYSSPIQGFDDLDINVIATTLDSFSNLWIAYNVYDGIDNNIYITIFNFITLTFSLQNVLSITENQNLTSIANITIVENPNALGSIILCDELNNDGTNAQLVNIWQISNLGIVFNIVNGNPSAIGQIRGVGLASKAFTYNGNSFVNTIWNSNLQSTYFTHCITNNSFSPIGKYNFQVGGNLKTNSLLPQSDLYNGNIGSFLIAGQRAGSFETNTSLSFTTLGVNANILNLNHMDSFNSIENSNNLFITGSVPQMYDGTSVTEVNFNLFPEGTVATVVSDDVGTNDGYYQYVITYEWTDQFGQVHRSQPSQPVLINNQSINVLPGQGVSLSIPTLRLTSKQDPRQAVQIVVYRTIATQTVYYTVASINNILSQDTITFLDNVPDSTIAANPPGYWQSQVPNTAPPPCSVICNYSSRTCLSGLDDPNIIWFSQDRYDVSNYNSVPIEFSALFTIGVDQYGNDGRQGITAIQKMDNNLYIFKQNAIFYVNSDGPLPSGTGDQFPLPSLLTSDVGCVNPNSIAFSPMGLLFDSGKGIYLLGRDQSVNYIGAPVEAYNELTITSAQLLDDTYEVIFTTQQGVMLVWNYYFNAPAGLWSTWMNLPAVDSTIWQNQLVILQANGHVLVQDNTNTVFQDNAGAGNKPIPLQIQLPWISSAMQSWNMIYSVILLGNFKGNHTLQCSVEYNYAPGIVETAMISSSLVYNTWGTATPTWGEAGSLWGGWNPTPYQFQLNFSRPMCQSIRLTFQDLQTSNYNEGYTLNNVVFNIQVLGGTGRVTNRARIGTIVTKGQ